MCCLTQCCLPRYPKYSSYCTQRTSFWFQFGRFRGGISARKGPGCGDAKKELRFPAFPLLANLPSSEAASDQRTGIADPTQRRGNIAEAPRSAHCASALLPHSFRGWRRIPFPAHKSLYAPVAPVHVTPAPQIINAGGKASFFFPWIFFFFSSRAFESCRETLRCD